MGDMRYIKVLLTLLVGFTTGSLFAQTDSLQVNGDTAVNQNEMVCFLTEQNTVTCFIAPDSLKGENIKESTMNDSIVPIEQQMESMNQKEDGIKEIKDEGANSGPERQFMDKKPESEESEPEDQTNFKMI